MTKVEDLLPMIVASLFVSVFMLFLLPNILNSVYASQSSSYVRPLMVAIAVSLVAAFLYFLVGRVGK